jgi:hypothetical protein
MKRIFWTTAALLLLIMACEKHERHANDSSDAGKVPPHIERLFREVPEKTPTDLMTQAGQVYMQMLPVVGREDLHASQEDWPLRAMACEISTGNARAIQRIVEAASQTRIVIINEAHDRPRHRDFIRQIAVALQPLGYSHYAAETFAESIADPSAPDYPQIEDGYYSIDPVFGHLIREVQEAGFSLHAYEFRGNSSSPELDTYARADLREEGQAENLARIFKSFDKNQRLLVHAGYSHAAEVPIRFFEDKDLAWMASRLKEKTGVDPLTIDQTDCEVAGDDPVLTNPGRRHQPGQFDIVVGHPPLAFDRGRPAWRLRGGFNFVEVPEDLRSESERVIIEARYGNEPKNSIPVDRLLLWPGEDLPLVLPGGNYKVTGYREESRSSISKPMVVQIR